MAAWQIRLGLLPHGGHGHLHVLGPVQRVEDAENVDPVLGTPLDQFPHDVVRVVRVAQRAAAAEQHLERDVGDLGPQPVEPVPRVFLEEPHGRVERGPAPHLQAEQPRASDGPLRRPRSPGRTVRNRVASSDWWASRIVVSVSSSGFCLRTHWQNLSGPSASSRCRSPLGTGPARGRHDRRRQLPLGVELALGVGPAVDDHVAQVGQDLGRPVPPQAEPEQLGRVVDERRRRLAGRERPAARSGSPGTGCSSSPRGCGTPAAPGRSGGSLSSNVPPQVVSFTSSAVEVRRDDRPAEPVPAIEADAEAAGAAVGRDPPVVGDELVLRVLGRDPALDRVAVGA